MTNLTIIYSGNTKEQYFLDAFAEYEKRLSADFKVTSVEIKEEKPPQNPSETQIAELLDREGEKILAAVPPRSFKTALCVEGAEISSEELAKKLEKARCDGYSSFTFIIGSSYGLSQKVKNACDFRLSFSKMTFTHRMARLILLEQIYRAQSIISGTKYHK